MDGRTAKVEPPAERRTLKAIAAGKRHVSDGATPDMLKLSDGSGAAVAVSGAALKTLIRDGLVARDGAAVELTGAGKAHLRRALAEVDPFQDQHRDIDMRAMPSPDGVRQVRINRAESPLGSLARRTGKDGRPLLAEAEVLAGERLRADYTRGQIMPRLSANWDAAIATGKRAGGATELTDGALAARQRVDRALDAVGPELAGLLVDFCCFLKGLETIEAERGWPARSAKIVLKTALGVLARHYEPPSVGRRRPIVAWGGAGYRPTIGG